MIQFWFILEFDPLLKFDPFFGIWSIIELRSIFLSTFDSFCNYIHFWFILEFDPFFQFLCQGQDYFWRCQENHLSNWTFDPTQENILFGRFLPLSSSSFDQARLGWSGFQIQVSCSSQYRKSQIFSRRRGWRCQVCIFLVLMEFNPFWAFYSIVGISNHNSLMEYDPFWVFYSSINLIHYWIPSIIGIFVHLIH